MNEAINYAAGLAGAAQAAGAMRGGAPAPRPAGLAGMGQGAGMPEVGMMPARAMRDAYESGQSARGAIDRGWDWMTGGGAGAGAAADEARFGGAGPPVSMVVASEPGGFAAGGLAGAPMRRARRLSHSGLVQSDTAGRADLVSTRVRRGSYVLPADVVSGLGEGNTLAGAKLLASTLPEAAAMAAKGAIGRAMGGLAEAEDELEVRLSGGEYLVAPEQVALIGEGDVKAGASALDQLVHSVRGQTTKTLTKLPPPK
jgi:hypothetical protein